MGFKNEVRKGSAKHINDDDDDHTGNEEIPSSLLINSDIIAFVISIDIICI
jgi:hypothetical protein